MAHEHGVVHRDLKPANIKLTPGRQGEGPRLRPCEGARSVTTSGPGRDATMSPTITSLGTVAGRDLSAPPAYMSPEQARGRRVDKRADIWAFGCVLYEMLTGELAFAGETISDTMAARVDARARLERDSPTVPPRVRGADGALPPQGPSRSTARHRRCEDRARRNPQEAVRRPARVSAAAVPFLPLLAAIAVVAALAGGTWSLAGGRPAQSSLLPAADVRPGRRALGAARARRADGRLLAPRTKAGRWRSSRRASTASSPAPIDVPSADIAGMSRDGQMALLLGRHYQGCWLRVGTLGASRLGRRSAPARSSKTSTTPTSPPMARVRGGRRGRGRPGAAVPDRKGDRPVSRWLDQPASDRARRKARAPTSIIGSGRTISARSRSPEPTGRSPLVAPERQYTQGLCWSPDGREVWVSTNGDEIRGGVLLKVSPGDASARRAEKPPRS